MNPIISFDYSITSPAMTVFADGKYDCFYITSNRKCQYESTKDPFNFHPTTYPIWTKPQERYEKLSGAFIRELYDRELLRDDCTFLIEDYAYGAKGKVFHIAENTELIKYKVWKTTGQEMLQIPPMTIKKVFSGKGNSDKEKMSVAFAESFGFSVHDLIGGNFDGPSNDIVDSVALNVVGQKLSSGELRTSDIFKDKKKPRAKREARTAGK